MIKNRIYQIFLGILALPLFTRAAFAQVDSVNEVAESMVNSTTNMPGLVQAGAYLFGIIFTITGLLKLKEHVDNERQVPLRTPVIRLLVGGVFLAFPSILTYVKESFTGGDTTAFGQYSNAFFDGTGVLGTISGWLSLQTNFNAMLGSIGNSIDALPALVTAVAYLLALLLTFSGIMKVKEHVEEPEKTSMKEPVARLVAAGALLGLPALFNALFNTLVDGGMGVGGVAMLTTLAGNFLLSSYEGGILGLGVPTSCLTLIGPDATLGALFCMMMLSTVGLPTFLTALSYLLGLVFGVWGIMKVRDHMLSPMQTKLNEGVMRLLAAAAFFAMPVLAIMISWSLTPGGTVLFVGWGGASTGFIEVPGLDVLCLAGGARSLDQVLACVMVDLLSPLQIAINFFCFCAGLVMMMIGISRLVKSSQDGPRGPGGLGTVTTFIVAGLLMSGTMFISVLSSSVFGDAVTATQANLLFVAGFDPAALVAAQNTVSAVVRFMIIIGMLSFVRGIFILRDSAEGKQQASVMSAATHIIGGALAVNIGPVLNAVQASLGIDAFGLTFS